MAKKIIVKHKGPLPASWKALFKSYDAFWEDSVMAWVCPMEMAKMLYGSDFVFKVVNVPEGMDCAVERRYAWLVKKLHREWLYLVRDVAEYEQGLKVRHPRDIGFFEDLPPQSLPPSMLATETSYHFRVLDLKKLRISIEHAKTNLAKKDLT